jgi:hypothetical protein
VISGARVGALALVVFVTGCGGGGAPAISVEELPSLVLDVSDVPATLSQFGGGKQARADIHPGARQDTTRFGREGGWIARFRRAGATAETPGPLVVESRADLFRTEAGAKNDLEAYRDEFETTPQRRLLTGPDLGQGAYAMVQQQGDVRFFSIAWRERNATAFVLVEGFAGRVGLADALALARKQDRHLLAAAER